MCLLGPRFREIGFIAAAAILGTEIVRTFQKRSFFFFVPALLLLQAFLPKGIPAILGLYNKPILVAGLFRTF